MSLRSWGSFGEEAGNFRYPWGITIYRGIVFITDSQNKRIQAFTQYGKYILETKCERSKDMADIVIVDDYIYVNDWEKCYLIKFKLIYD